MKQPVTGKTAVISDVAPANWARWCGLSVVGIALAGMLAFTWREWPEPIVDFGRELYVPWQLVSGKVLYRDIAYFNGPLSPYFNSLVFRVLGVSLMSLVTANIAVLIVIVLMFHRLLAGIADEFSATVACVTFVVLLSCGQAGMVANYNFITPYSHEMTHGLALALGAILCMARFAETRKTNWIGVNGALLGLLFLTKPEIFVAAMAASAIGIILTLGGIEKRMIPVAVWFASLVAPVLFAFALLAFPLGLLRAFDAILGGWRFAFDPSLVHNQFYQRVRGTYDKNETAWWLTIMTMGYIVLFGLPSLVAAFIPREKTGRILAMLASVGGTVLILAARLGHIKWEEVARPLVFFAFVCVIMLSWNAFRAKPAQAKTIHRLAFAIFSLLLLGKIALKVSLYHYSFALAAPALTLCIISVCAWLPRWIDARGGSGSIVTGTMIGALLVTAGVYVYRMNQVYSAKTIIVGTGSDWFLSNEFGPGYAPSVNNIVHEVEQLPPNSTLAVLPQGAMINYLTGRANPTPYMVVMPPEVLMFGADRILESYERHPPDYIVLVDWDVSEYGVKGFTIDYGKPIFDWIVANYRPVLRRDEQAFAWVLVQHRPAQ